jgi:outer membrane protein TolC
VAEVVAAFRVAYARRRALTAAQQAVEAARESYRLNEQRVRRAPEQGRPIELLQAVQALARARLDYLFTVADYNRAQFRLYTAMGNPPLCALDTAAQVSVEGERREMGDRLSCATKWAFPARDRANCVNYT